jgi:uncharacterized protein (DUF433 family)
MKSCSNAFRSIRTSVSGKPCIRGHPIWVSLILDLLASWTTVEEILHDYPQLTRDDVRACIAYGGEMSRER